MEQYFILYNENGDEIQCETLATFYSEETNKDYIIYTDNQLDEEGNYKVYASIYNMNEEGFELIEVETDEEWEMIASILETAQNEALEDNE